MTVPRRWTLILRERAETARPVRPEDCHGLLNTWWPQPCGEHTGAKKWAMNGWPVPLGDRLHHWTLTWLDDVPPPLDPSELVGRAQRIGDHLMEPLSVTRTFDTGYATLLSGEHRTHAPRTAELRSHTPVVTTTRDATGDRIPHVWPDPRRLFGAVHRSGGGIVGGSGAVGAVARFAPPELAEPWLDLVLGGMAKLRRTPLPGEEIRLGEHHHADNRSVLAWQGGMRLELVGGDPRHVRAFASLLELVELAGVGKYTAQGFGSVRVDTVTAPEPDTRAAARRSGRQGRGTARRTPHRVHEPRRPAVAEAGEFGGALFD
ncbi:CRISPR system precrRNA processing endoribonuclease RAMP protein Cas6 [Nocardiopsis kunsanensis]|uniref:CRISPR system precrRNA processing endoribonuclease RAMP protein Cas6 n=1 Tax=Nocardiopsis kunsanensis TaxID=141693 RepID=UPI0003620C2A|nr:CRISPR system precrRNA processing endoribonuclease RAMP protein Cas6 [Nocardiopsis kunsanensis]